LYVAMGGAGKRIDRYTVGANGATAVANPAALQAQYADDLEGIAVDTGGNIWVAESARATNPDNPPNGGRVEVFAPDGKKHGEIVFPGHRPINVAFGGADNKTVYIVANRNANAGGGGSADYSGFIFTFTTRCAGVR
jgi:sugar lactone lactonase YvrE